MSVQRENLKKSPILVSGVPSGDQPGNKPLRQWRFPPDSDTTGVKPVIEKIVPLMPSKPEVGIRHRPRPEIIERMPSRALRIPA